MKKIATRIQAIVLAIIVFISISPLCTNCLDAFTAFASDEVIDYTEYGLGDIESDPYEYENDPLCKNISTCSSVYADDLPDSVDLSETPYFPPIGNQQGVGSCVAWATTYYQYTYEVNRLNDTTATADNAYSPSWVYNFLNGGVDYGTYNTAAYNILEMIGAVHSFEDPYQSVDGSTDNIKSENYDYSWCTDTDAMIDALNTRLTSYSVMTIPEEQKSEDTPIKNNHSDILTKVKSILAGENGETGKVLDVQVSATTGLNNWSYKDRLDPETGETVYITNSSGEKVKEQVVYEAIEGDGGHAMTIVGYDDNVWCDINNDGEVDDGELGAFKVANSWGDSWRNNGFVWVAYDALNHVTSVSGDWDTATSRISIFDRNKGAMNRFYSIEVENEDVYYVGQLTVDTNYRNSLSISSGRSESDSSEIKNLMEIILCPTSYDKNIDIDMEISYQGTLVFDYGSLADPIGDYINDYNWFVRVTGNHNSLSFKITDNLSNTIVDLGQISSGDSYSPINLSMGDLDYNGILNSNDQQILYDAMYNGKVLSNLQKYLAQYWDDTELPSNDNYTVSYEVTADWGTGQNVQVTITNTGDEAIRNWALYCDDFCGTVSNIWNAVLYSDNIVENASYNSDIVPGESVTFGYTLTNATGGIPTFTMCTYRSVKEDGYTVSVDVLSDWGSGFIGAITITNTTDTPIMAWELSFDTVNFTISDTSQFVILDNSGNNYKITGTYNGNIPIPANTSITLQFNGVKSDTPELSNVVLTEMIF